MLDHKKKAITEHWQFCPKCNYKTLSNDRRLHWIHPYKMLALPENVMARPFHSGQVNISFIKQSGATAL